ncbi:hypothetical protein Leryth_014666 [Lithospermum erythrorhizon]|nr:hypothetical protein Leryth_014666 [Lithospermum erythrorhizon]
MFAKVFIISHWNMVPQSAATNHPKPRNWKQYWRHGIRYCVMFGERLVSSLRTNHGSTPDIESIFGIYMIIVLKKTSDYLLSVKLYGFVFEVCFVFEACFWSMKILT